jgi:Domain of unknown function (DUF6046)
LAKTDLSINTLFEQIFGFKRGMPLDSGQINKETLRNAGGDLDAPKSSESEFSIFRDVRALLSGNYLGQPIFMPVQLGEIVLPNEPTMSIGFSKTVVKTTMVGSNLEGTIKELISNNDYEITIRGIIINPFQKKVYPEDEVSTIHQLVRRGESLKILSGLTALLGIEKVVIEDLQFPPMVGIQHAQAYEIKMYSDRDWVLTID